MNLNYLLSLVFAVISCIAILKIVNFIKSNKLENAILLWIFTINLFIFCLACTLEIISSNIELAVLFHTIKTLALSLLPGLIFLIFFDIAKLLYKVKPYHYIIIFIIPAISIVLSITLKYHSLFMYDFVIDSQDVFTYLRYTKGIWFYVFSLYFIILMTLLFLAISKYYPKYKKNKRPMILLLLLIALVVACIIIEAQSSNSRLLFVLPLIIPLFSLILSMDVVSYRLFNSIPFAYKKAFEWSDNCLLILDKELNLIDFNTTAEESIPLISSKMLYANISEFIDYDSRIKKAILSDTDCRIKIIRDYTVKHYRISSSPLHNKANTLAGYMVSIVDITELVDTMAELTELASIDTLTSTYTRRYFVQRANSEFLRAKRHSHPLSFIILDLDYFKNINDEYGHLAGDYMLTEVANICRSKIRSVDLLGRFGGEEFMIMLPETDLESAMFVAERIRKSIAKTEFIYDKDIMHTTVSLGVTGAQKVTDDSFDSFLKYADRALYRAKDGGRNKVEYDLSEKNKDSDFK